MVSAGVTEFLSLLALLLGGGMIGAWIMQKIKFPTIIGFIAIGMIAGPYGLSIVDDPELINLLAEFGIIILLFVVGLEFSLQKLQQVGLKAILVGVTELGIMFFLSYIAALYLGWTHLEATYLAGILAISSTAISLRLLRDMNLVKSREWNSVVTILIVEDLVAVLLLAILANASAGGGADIFGIATLILQSVVFFVLSLGIGIKVIPKLLERVSSLQMQEAPFITALALGFGMAVLAHFLGLSTAIGAFLMGMIIASSRHSEAIVEKVLPLRDFFGVIFFVSIGMLVNLSFIPDVVWVSIPIIILAVVGKFIGNFFASSMGGHNFEGASTIGSVMVPRGEFSYIIAKQGVDTGAIRESIYPITVVVSLVTMFCMPLLLRVLPTLADRRYVVPLKILNPVYVAGKFFRQALATPQSESRFYRVVKEYSPTLFMNLIIVVTILAVINYFEEDIIAMLESPEVPFFMEPELFITILTWIIISYPILTLVGKIEDIVEVISDTITGRIVSRRKQRVIDKPVHRVVRNILFAGFLLLMIAILESLIIDAQAIPYIRTIISGAGIVIAAFFIIDTFLAIKKVSKTHLLDSLLQQDEPSSDNESEDEQGHTEDDRYQNNMTEKEDEEAKYDKGKDS